jgi:hypothetical protein
MVENIDGTLSFPSVSRPIERVGAAAEKPKPDPVSEKAAVTTMPTYDFQFRVNTETHEITAVLVNPETRAVIREIPAEEMHAASDVIRSLIGPLIDKTV